MYFYLHSHANDNSRQQQQPHDWTDFGCVERKICGSDLLIVREKFCGKIYRKAEQKSGFLLTIQQMGKSQAEGLTRNDE